VALLFVCLCAEEPTCKPTKKPRLAKEVAFLEEEVQRIKGEGEDLLEHNKDHGVDGFIAGERDKFSRKSGRE
jgi:putative NIF3 family GTP cyclohydrolase 1 type 2